MIYYNNTQTKITVLLNVRRILHPSLYVCTPAVICKIFLPIGNVVFEQQPKLSHECDAYFLYSSFLFSLILDFAWIKWTSKKWMASKKKKSSISPVYIIIINHAVYARSSCTHIFWNVAISCLHSRMDRQIKWGEKNVWTQAGFAGNKAIPIRWWWWWWWERAREELCTCRCLKMVSIINYRHSVHKL